MRLFLARQAVGFMLILAGLALYLVAPAFRVPRV